MIGFMPPKRATCFWTIWDFHCSFIQISRLCSFLCQCSSDSPKIEPRRGGFDLCVRDTLSPSPRKHSQCRMIYSTMREPSSHGSLPSCTHNTHSHGNHRWGHFNFYKLLSSELSLKSIFLQQVMSKDRSKSLMDYIYMYLLKAMHSSRMHAKIHYWLLL